MKKDEKSTAIKILPTVGLVVLQDNKLLLAYSNNKQAWYLPGGKLDDGETPVEALLREVEEELNLKMAAEELSFYAHITAPAFGEELHVQMEQDCYLYDLKEAVRPGNEIGGVQFFDYSSYQLEAAQVPGVIQLFQKLRADKLII